MFDLHVAPHLLFMAFHHKLSLYLREALAKHSIKLVGIPQGREEPAKGHRAHGVRGPSSCVSWSNVVPAQLYLASARPCRATTPAIHRATSAPHPV